MRKGTTRRLTLTAIGALGMAGCSTPYGLKVSSADLESAPMPGTITFSGPKLYRREALINERREEANYLKELLDDSKTAKFLPDIVRQIEVIKILSVSLGLKFDPAAGAQNRLAEERAGIQQDLDTLRLEMQLDKLRRDAALLSEQPAKQNEPPAGSGDSTAGRPDTATKPVDVAAPSVQELQKAITDLRALLTRDLGDKATALTPLEESFANPIDTFNDRAAYREILNGARNAASLDELHDRDGAALIRLNMIATVFPPKREYRASFGRLHMQVERPNPADEGYTAAFAGLYRDWLHHLSLDMSQPKVDATGNIVGFDLTTLGSAVSSRTDLLDVVEFEFGTEPNSQCRGLSMQSFSQPQKGCMVLHLATPRVAVHGSIRGSDASLHLLANKFSDPLLPYERLFRAIADQGLVGSYLGSRCELSETIANRSIDISGVPPGEVTLGQLVPLAFALDKLASLTPFVESEARALAGRHDKGQVYFRPFNGIPPESVVAAREIVDQVNMAAQSRGCVPKFVTADIPEAFLKALNYGGTPSIYQVGPKQQVQIVSTQARAAEEIALAASLAGQAPNQGIGASAASNFGRRAVGRADALERVPLVVGYADSATPGSFGWMMGPRAGLDPAHSKLTLEQGLRPQDLSVDLILPGWWPYLTLSTGTTWSPQWSGRGGDEGQEGARHSVRVALAPAAADFEQITSHVLGGSTLKRPVISEIEPALLPACAVDIAIQLRGPQLWRATQVVIGGKIYDAKSIEVLPGLEGILVKNVMAESPVTGPPLLHASNDSRSVVVTALTPYGPARGTLGLKAAKQNGCNTVLTKPDEK